MTLGDLSNHRAFLRHMRNTCGARTYLEIGVETGHTLLMADGTTELAVGVDPDFKLVTPAEQPVRIALFRKTSDDFFADGDWGKLTASPVDLTFVDGMHWCEYAFRDILNAERLSHRRSAILVHDIVPGSAEEAARERCTSFWMGDVFRVIPALRKFRPDLTVTCLADVMPSGMLLISGLDPEAAPVDLAAAEAFMLDVDYDRDFDAAVRSTLVSVRSPEFETLARQLARRPGWRRPVRLKPHR